MEYQAQSTIRDHSESVRLERRARIGSECSNPLLENHLKCTNENLKGRGIFVIVAGKENLGNFIREY